MQPTIGRALWLTTVLAPQMFMRDTDAVSGRA
jgi:hypothetical protein